MDHDLILVRDVEARYALRGRLLHYTVLVPFGRWVGRGALRVLRATVTAAHGDAGEVVDLVLGYDAYEAA
ncbi:MAG TPA: hypothetical protein VIN40_06530 [Candidatus Tyrphobacter sp.]